MGHGVRIGGLHRVGHHTWCKLSLPTTVTTFYADIAFPQWLKTDLGSQNADLLVEVGVESVKKIILDAKTSDNGKFRNIQVHGWEKDKVDGSNYYEGEEVPW